MTRCGEHVHLRGLTPNAGIHGVPLLCFDLGGRAGSHRREVTGSHPVITHSLGWPQCRSPPNASRTQPVPASLLRESSQPVTLPTKFPVAPLFPLSKGCR